LEKKKHKIDGKVGDGESWSWVNLREKLKSSPGDQKCGWKLLKVDCDQMTRIVMLHNKSAEKKRNDEASKRKEQVKWGARVQTERKRVQKRASSRQQKRKAREESKKQSVRREQVVERKKRVVKREQKAEREKRAIRRKITRISHNKSKRHRRTRNARNKTERWGWAKNVRGTRKIQEHHNTPTQQQPPRQPTNTTEVPRRTSTSNKYKYFVNGAKCRKIACFTCGTDLLLSCTALCMKLQKKDSSKAQHSHNVHFSNIVPKRLASREQHSAKYSIHTSMF